MMHISNKDKQHYRSCYPCVRYEVRQCKRNILADDVKNSEENLRV